MGKLKEHTPVPNEQASTGTRPSQADIRGAISEVMEGWDKRRQVEKRLSGSTEYKRRRGIVGASAFGEPPSTGNVLLDATTSREEKFDPLSPLDSDNELWDVQPLSREELMKIFDEA